MPQHYTCFILLDVDLHLVYFIMQNYPVTREWDEVDWLDPLVMKHHSPKKTRLTEHSAAQLYKDGTISSAGSVSTTTGRQEQR